MQDLSSTVFIGDNLDFIRGIDSESIDLIYLDPPFNSNKIYSAPIGSESAGVAFKDFWTLSDVDLIEHNRLKREQEWLYALIYAAGKTHSKGMFSYLMMMSSRLFELRRVLKPTGSIYVHCDPTASHYLKLLMDGIFGNSNFRNEIVWKRTSSHNRAKRWGPIHDILLFYSVSNKFKWNRILQPLDAGYVERFYRHEDKIGRFRIGDLTGPGERNGESGGAWRHVDPTSKGRHWELPPDRALPDWFAFPVGYSKLSIQDRLDILDAQGLIHWPKKEQGVPGFKRYLGKNSGSPIQDLILDVEPLSAASLENTDFPTQKPIALLDRIISASSNEGDLVLDPFCGCATTLVSAEFLNRRWCGIDLSSKAADLVALRIAKKRDLFAFDDFRKTSEIPIRTDIERPLADTPTKRIALKYSLYTEQEGHCNICHTYFDHERHFQMDHIFPKAKGGQDWADNFQLLCANCNQIKGDGTQEQARARLAKIKGIDFGVFG